MDYENKIDIPFGAKDSELKGWEYTIPEGMEAIIKDGKVIVREKESEDEKIRKWLIKEMHRFHDCAIKEMCQEDINKTEIALAWLEKQKELTAQIVPGYPGHYFYDGNKLHLCSSPAMEEKQKGQKPIISDDAIREGVAHFGITQYQIDNWLKKHINVMEQKPAEWNEEDETALGDLMWCIEQARKSAKDENDMGNIWFAENWLKNRFKSIRPQPQHRDTYYDIIHNILATLKDMDFTKITPEHRVSLLNDIRVKCKNADECAAILDEPHWKPSEEQMDALRSKLPTIMGTGNYVDSLLESLFQDLKKL